MKAVKIIKPGLAEVVDAPLPQLPSLDYILVKTVAVALNPSDWKHVRVVKDQVTVGLDYAGVVQEVNPTVAERFKKGDRVAGFVIGSNSLHPDNGAFAEYVAAKAGALVKIPDTMSFEDAAGLGVGIVTVGQGLYQEMQLPWPDQPLKEKKSILIYGGSSAMGAFGIQFAKLYVYLSHSTGRFS
jgi:NADPH:quinone reductase-like Zn-dependent oxidoreductase